VTEVATRALKAVRYQKFNLHRRLRPEALAARLEKRDAIKARLTGWDSAPLDTMFEDLTDAGVFSLGNLPTSKLLPMAFCEGSPMHPSYGAGHATVAGACVTILKAFFNSQMHLDIDQDGNRVNYTRPLPAVNRAFVPTTDGSALNVTTIPEPLTIGGELNKLAANISIGRNWAGVHYYTDYTKSMELGEKIAIGLLEEQAITYNPAERFYMNLHKFNGDWVRISENGVDPIVESAL